MLKIKALRIFSLFILFITASAFAVAADISISPPSITVSPSSQFTVNVNVANVSNLFGVAFDLVYNPAVVQFISAQKGTFLEQDGASTNLLTSASPPGTLIVGYSRLANNGVATGITGSGSLMTLTFNALTTGTSNLSFQNNALCDANSGSGCNQILTNWTGGVANAQAAAITISNLSFTPKIEGTTNVSGKDFTITVFTAGTSNQLARFTVQTDVSGKLALPTTVSMQSGSYDILVSSPNYLKKKMAAVNLSSDATVVLPTLSAGDFNNDNAINSLDWSLMSPKWFSQDPVVDVNKDNIVNTIDFSFLNKNWALVGD